MQAACAAAAVSDTQSGKASESTAQRAFDEAMEAPSHAQVQPSPAAATTRAHATLHHRGSAAATPQKPSTPEARSLVATSIVATLT